MNPPPEIALAGGFFICGPKFLGLILELWIEPGGIHSMK
jgi:hypothetical protein